jgi:hypothetical protein
MVYLNHNYDVSARETVSTRRASAIGVMIMLRIIAFLIAILAIPVTSSKAQALYCGQAFDVSAARVRWTVARRSGVDPSPDDARCHAYFHQFFEAVTARQTVSICGDGIDRQRNLEILDTEIDAFNNLIAAQCGSS